MRQKRENDRTGQRQPACPRAVRIVALLLVIQAAGLLGLGLVHTVASYALPWLNAEQVGQWLAAAPVDLTGVWARLLEIGKTSARLTILFVPLGLLAFLTALGFCRRRLFGWTAAMTVQSIQLLCALILYFTSKPAYVSLLMLYGVLMVVYLNYSEVANAFGPRRTPLENQV
ncbi:MAG: hypothetical protein JW934_22800 [Anaerolineae bacterium]|nr:hypothetical protein [Anaerolineae bacterium]